MPDPADIKVTRIGVRWHCRVTWKGEPLVEVVTDRQDNIQWCCREAMRMANKLGYVSPRTCASRMRHGGKRTSRQTGRYWFVLVPGCGGSRKLDKDSP